MARIYYGPEGRETSIHWKVKVTDSRVAVVINGNLMHALKGQPGVTIGCGLSNAAIDKNNITSFPHPVHLAVFNKTTALFVDKLKKDGSPLHAVRYAHSYGWITDKNDNGSLKRIARDNPELVERSFTLRSVLRHKNTGTNPGTGPKSKATTGKKFIPRGALARAVKAGRIGKNVADQLTEVVAASSLFDKKKQAT